jgi:hypothetical protein
LGFDTSSLSAGDDGTAAGADDAVVVAAITVSTGAEGNIKVGLVKPAGTPGATPPDFSSLVFSRSAWELLQEQNEKQCQ